MMDAPFIYEETCSPWLSNSLKVHSMSYFALCEFFNENAFSSRFWMISIFGKRRHIFARRMNVSRCRSNTEIVNARLHRSEHNRVYVNISIISGIYVGCAAMHYILHTTTYVDTTECVVTCLLQNFETLLLKPIRKIAENRRTHFFCFNLPSPSHTRA